jgi:hypothetical protein
MSLLFLFAFLDLSLMLNVGLLTLTTLTLLTVGLLTLITVTLLTGLETLTTLTGVMVLVTGVDTVSPNDGL